MIWMKKIKVFIYKINYKKKEFHQKMKIINNIISAKKYLKTYTFKQFYKSINYNKVYKKFKNDF